MFFLFTHLLSVFAQPHKGEETALLALHHREGGRQALEAARDAIYVDSTNPRYGQFLTAAETADLLAPDISVYNQVESWLSAGVSAAGPDVCPDGTTDISLEHTRCVVRFRAATGCVQHVLQSEGHRAWRGEKDSDGVFPTPAELQQHVLLTMVAAATSATTTSGTSFSEANPVSARGSQPSNKTLNAFPGLDITPPIIWSMYGVPPPTKETVAAVAASGASQAVAEFEQGYFFNSDTVNFQAKYNCPIENMIVNGPNHPNTGYLGEASLDVEYISTVGYGIRTIVWSVAGTGFDLMSWALNVSGSADPGLLHSISWGSPEQNYNATWEQRLDTEFLRLATMGLTVLAASGDDGPNNDGIIGCKNFHPTFPASSPHVTAVGGTYFPKRSGKAVSGDDANNAASDDPEVCWASSGGGFSGVFARPQYQDAAIMPYLSAKGLPEASRWNSSGRAVPDVSAVSTNFQVLIQNFTGPISGTSAATPTFAGIVSLINAKRLAAGKKGLGFLNYALYGGKAGAGVGYDVQQGATKSDGFCKEGWPATAGWDACTGLAAPRYETLLDTLMAV